MNTLKLIDLYRSYRIRKSFIEHRDLLLKHERLLRIGRQKETGTAKAKIKKTDNDKKRVVHNAGSFLGNECTLLVLIDFCLVIYLEFSY